MPRQASENDMDTFRVKKYLKHGKHLPVEDQFPKGDGPKPKALSRRQQNTCPICKRTYNQRRFVLFLEEGEEPVCRMCIADRDSDPAWSPLPLPVSDSPSEP